MNSPLRFLRLGTLGLLLACGAPLDFEPAGPSAAPDPSARGPFQVGVKTVSFEDPSRTGPDGGPRKLEVEIWYPATDASKDAPRASYAATDVFLEEAIRSAGPIELNDVPSDAARDAAPREDRGPFPLVLFSHGAYGTRIQSLFYTTALASHGYVVVAPDHTGNTLQDLESVDELLAGLVDFGGLTQSLVDRAPDLLFVLRQVRRLDDPIVDQIDFDRLGVTGHSFGATTALRTITLDDRFETVVAHTPASYLISWLDMPKELDEIDKPMLIMAGARDGITPKDPWVDSIWEHVQQGDYVSLNRAGHLTFSDLCALDPQLLTLADDLGLGRSLDEGCRPQNIPIEEAHRLILQVSIGQFNLHLRDSEDSARYLKNLQPAEELIQLEK